MSGEGAQLATVLCAIALTLRRLEDQVASAAPEAPPAEQDIKT